MFSEFTRSDRHDTDVSRWKNSDDLPNAPFRAFGPERHGEVMRKLLEIATRDYILNIALVGDVRLAAGVSDILLERGRFEILIPRLAHFEVVDLRRLAMRAIENGRAKIVLEHLEKFNPTDDRALATDVVCQILEKSRSANVLEQYEEGVFRLVDHNRLVQILCALPGRSAHFADVLRGYRAYLRGLTAETALALVETRNENLIHWGLATMRECFVGLDRRVAAKLIEYGGSDCAAKMLDSFSGLDQGVALALARSGNGYSVFQNADLFANVDLQAVLLGMAATRVRPAQLFEVCWTDSGREAWDQADQNLLAEAMIENGHGELLMKHLEKLARLDHKRIALRMIGAGSGRTCMDFSHKFADLDGDVTRALIENGLGNRLANEFERWVLIDPNLEARLRNENRARRINKKPRWVA